MRTNAKVTDINTTKTGVESVTYLDRNTDEKKVINHVTDVIVTAGPWTGKVLPRTKVEGLRVDLWVDTSFVSSSLTQLRSMLRDKV